ncbi:MAG TPA: hypothetical protein VFG18_04635 [Xanthomonadaceae bacterium]|nr:hypothetical protein [Xanthomonadaceae bacterium]
MDARATVTWLLAATVACAACSRQGDEATARVAADPLHAYRAHLLPAEPLRPKPGSINATYLGGAMLLFDDGDTQFLIDPFLGTRGANDARPGRTAIPFLGPLGADDAPDHRARIDEAFGRIRAERLQAIFVAGGDARITDAAYIARRTGARLFAPGRLLERARAAGVPQRQLVVFGPGTTARVGKFRIEQIASRPTPPPQDEAADGAAQGGGNAADFLIRKGSRSILVKPAANFIPGALDHVNADVLFLATESLAGQSDFFRDLYYRQTVGQVHPELVIPLHWDDASQPSGRMLAPADDTPAAFDFLIARLKQDGIRFGLLQGYQTTELFAVHSCAIPVVDDG